VKLVFYFVIYVSAENLYCKLQHQERMRIGLAIKYRHLRPVFFKKTGASL
jgi:hypothetical protein